MKGSTLMTTMLSEVTADAAEVPVESLPAEPDDIRLRVSDLADAVAEELAKIPEEEPNGPIVLVLSPGQIRLSPNVRRAAELDDDFVQSIEQHGVLQPITTVWRPDHVEVIFGQRRLAAATKAGVKIPCFVLPKGLATDERILQQLDENDQRKPVSAADRAASLFELQELGYSVTKIAKATRMKKDEVETALAAAQVSQEAKESVGVDTAWTITEIADLQEFEGDEDALAQLKAAKERGQFNQRVGYLRDARETQRARQELADKLTASGIKVLTERPEESGKAKQLWKLFHQDGTRIAEDAHAECPGHAVVVTSNYAGKAVSQAYCTAWKDLGHVYSDTGVPKPKQDKAQRKLIVDNNRMWRADRDRRHEWLVAFFTRKAAPAGTSRYLAKYLARRPYSLSKWIGSLSIPLAPEFIGLPADTNGKTFTETMDKMIATATEKRVQLLQLVTMAAALEKGLENPQCWRNPGTETEGREWLKYLGDAGYELSEFEQQFIDGTTRLPAASTNTQPTASGPTASDDPDDGEDDFEDDFEDGDADGDEDDLDDLDTDPDTEPGNGDVGIEDDDEDADGDATDEDAGAE